MLSLIFPHASLSSGAPAGQWCDPYDSRCTFSARRTVFLWLLHACTYIPVYVYLSLSLPAPFDDASDWVLALPNVPTRTAADALFNRIRPPRVLPPNDANDVRIARREFGCTGHVLSIAMAAALRWFKELMMVIPQGPLVVRRIRHSRRDPSLRFRTLMACRTIFFCPSLAVNVFTVSGCFVQYFALVDNVVFFLESRVLGVQGL